MELFPVRNVLGYGGLFTALRLRWRWLRSGNWISVTGVVESYELLMARRAGWFVVFYSYAFEGTQFAGEWRKLLWFWFPFSSLESEAAAVTARLPRGARIEVRVDPEHPDTSIAEL
jgi:Protein of unknown function (DUF3592)